MANISLSFNWHILDDLCMDFIKQFMRLPAAPASRGAQEQGSRLTPSKKSQTWQLELGKQ